MTERIDQRKVDAVGVIWDMGRQNDEIKVGREGWKVKGQEYARMKCLDKTRDLSVVADLLRDLKLIHRNT